MFSGLYFKVGNRNNEKSGYEVINSKNGIVITRTATLEEANKLAQRWNLEYECDVQDGHRTLDGVLRYPYNALYGNRYGYDD